MSCIYLGQYNNNNMTNKCDLYYRTGVSILIHKFENDSTMQLKQGLSVVLYEQSTKCNRNMNTDASRYIDPTQMQVHTI